MEIYNFKAFAVMLSDQSMWADVMLQDFTLEDTRSIRKSGVTRFVISKLYSVSIYKSFKNAINIFLQPLVLVYFLLTIKTYPSFKKKKI